MTAPPAADARPSGPNGWLVIGGIVTALLLVAGGLSVANWLGYRTEIQNEVYSHSTDRITFDLGVGDLTLVPGRPGVLSVQRHLHWSFAKPVIDERWEGRTLRVAGGCANRRWFDTLCRVDYTLEVPQGVTVRANTSTGDITVQDITGELYLTTSTGDIRVTGAANPMVLRTSTGDIVARELTSITVDAETSTGDIRLYHDSAPLTVSARTSTGDVEVVVPDGERYDVQADTSTGDVRILIDDDDAVVPSITARTSTGDVDIRYG